jgi:adenylate kinase
VRKKMIMIYGPAGAGKSTQGRMLAAELGRTWLSAGQLIRDSKRFEEYTHTGAMIPEELLVALLTENMYREIKSGKDVVFDGQPGSVEQVEMLEKTGIFQEVEFVVDIRVDENELYHRLSLRGREDDNMAVWQRKINYYLEKSVPFLAKMKEKGLKIYEVDGNGDEKTVNQRILALVETEKCQNYWCRLKVN